MRVLYERCAGLDVHKKTVVACAITPQGQAVRGFGAMTEDLRELGQWLLEQGVTHVAMESSGVYWKPVYNLLEELGLELLVANARHIKAVPGRKTDVKDAEWIADLLRHGLLRPSFIPDRAQRELRELVRYRREVIGERSRIINSLQQVLEGANIKLGNVASDVVGVSGRAMLSALVEGTHSPAQMAALAQGQLRDKRRELEAALTGVMGAHQALLLGSLLRRLDSLQEEVERLDAEVAERLSPFKDKLAALDSIPGVGVRGAEEIVAEIGMDMSRFPSVHHLCSWAKVCPGNHQSAGKRLSGSTGRGNPWLRGALVEAAWAASHAKNSYLCAQYHRLAARRGKKRAAMAVAHSILTIIYYLLTRGGTYQDLGHDYLDQRSRDRIIAHAVHRIEALGFNVTLQEVA